MNKINKMLLGLGLCAVMAAPAWGYGWIPSKGEPIPVKESIEAMMRNNHSLKALQENRSAVGHEVDRAKGGSPGSLGEFGWGGAAGATVLVDPERKLSIFYAHHMLNSQEEYYQPRLRNVLYSCIGR